ncbi:hypothetical protein NT6N_26020 [Oceaniferula spumae]|uniref:SGNH hydrolase-type esterase domain-containing protein n=1 Tax=Oceaniferula spumae TaxID=2979115 RepID=A0AAT9FNS8_9BACT
MNRFLPLIGAILLTTPAQADSIVRDGDHIAIVGNTFADQLRNHGYMETLLQQHADISLRNLGWAGDTLTQRDRPTNFPTEETTLTEQKTDVIIACFGMGEAFAGEQGVAAFKNNLKAFIASHKAKKYNGQSSARLVIVSPIAYEDHGLTTPNAAARDKDLAAYTAAAKETASAVGVPFIDLYTPTRAMMDKSGSKKYTTNGIHLTPLGYWAVSHILAGKLVEGAAEPWGLTIDAQAKTSTADGVKLSAIKAEKKNLSFSVTETTAASPPPPTNGKTPAHFAKQRDTLTIKNLSPGEYTLTIDGVDISTADHVEWAQGVTIDSSPAHKEAQNFREEVKDKNLQFLYNWKALNQVHIVGERKRSPSGKALPAEQIEFNNLAIQKEKILRQPREVKTREWKLTSHGL